MKNMFEVPEVYITKFAIDDVIATSIGGGNANEGGAGDDEDI